MHKPGLLTYVAQFAPGLFRVRRSTWITVGVGLLVFLGFLIWAAMALIGWLWGQTQTLAGAAPDAVRGTARGVVSRVEEFVPGARAVLDQVAASVPDARGALGRVTEQLPGASELLVGILPASKPEAPLQRDVSGQDLGPVARFPGLARTQWQRTAEGAVVDYEGKADYVKVLDYYAKGFVSAGFEQTVQSSTLEAETHQYTKDRERLILKIAQKPKGLVGVRIETAWP
jgi:hypothetical protein